MAELSIIIPTLNAAEVLPACLKALETDLIDTEILVVDGWSEDNTLAIAQATGARAFKAPKGRGSQLKAGASEASAPWMLFLHADTVLVPNWAKCAQDFIKKSEISGRSAVFTYALDDDSPQARRVERLTRWRGRVLGLPYGDQGLLIHKRLYDQIGGYNPLPLMEDLDIIKRIGKNRIDILECQAATSALRYHRDGWWARPVRNLFCLSLWSLGFSVDFIMKIYHGADSG